MRKVTLSIPEGCSVKVSVHQGEFLIETSIENPDLYREVRFEPVIVPKGETLSGAPLIETSPVSKCECSCGWSGEEEALRVSTTNGVRWNGSCPKCGKYVKWVSPSFIVLGQGPGKPGPYVCLHRLEQVDSDEGSYDRCIKCGSVFK